VSLPERWTLIHRTEDVYDPVSGNSRPGETVEVPWKGLLQQRQLSASSVDAGSTEFEDGHVASAYVLLLEPGLTPFPSRRDAFRGPDGEVLQVVGKPRVRKPARGSRKPAYIAAIVRNSSDYEE
jgi:hypothetical protein